MASFLDQDFGSESEDDTFNPAPAADESDAEDAANDSDAEVAQKQQKSSRGGSVRSPKEEDGDDEDVKPAMNRANGDVSGGEEQDDEKDAVEEGEDDEEDGGHDDGEDEEDEDEEEEEDEDEQVTGHRRKRARRERRNQFLDVEAEVDEDEDEEIEEDDELEQPGGFIADTHPDDLADLPAGADIDDRRHRELDRRRELEASLDAEKQAAALRERYGRNRVAATTDDALPKRLLLPSVEDPSIWGVRCKPGKEREAIFGIMKRVEERALSRQPLSITAAFERGGTMAGYIYVEARKQADVMAAVDGLMNVYPRNRTGSAMILVPIKEMPDLLRTKKSKTLDPGMYVRIKSGKYQGDLAQIDAVEQNGLEVSLRIVPRLDYGQNEDLNAPDNAVGLAAKRKRAGGFGAVAANRPPQRLFSEAEARKRHMRYLQPGRDRKTWNYMGELYENGFLIKDFKIQRLQTENVQPTLEEVTKFTAGAEDGTENLDLAALSASLKASTASTSFVPGDMVEVYEGEQKGVWGKVSNVQGDIVKLTVTEGDLRGQSVEVPVKGLRKRFREGDHVKVIGGSRYRDEVGMVVRLSDDRVTVLSDLSMQEITVFSKDLREATDSGATGRVGKFDLYDLVQLDPATVACVIKVDRESLRVLDQNGSVRNMLPSQVSNKIEKRRHAVATDRNGSEIRHDDTVREIGGDARTGVIQHIYRSFLFLHNREQTENSGIFVVRSGNVATVAAKGGRVTGATAGPDLTKMNPAMQRNAGTNGTGPMAPPKSFGRDRLLGHTVIIKRGTYKGLLGIVKDTTDTDARVELYTKGKTITVSKDTLGVKDKVTGRNIDINGFGGGRGGGGAGRGGFGGATPSRVPQAWEGGRTPFAAGDGGRTPAWGAANRTPAHPGIGGRTPAWKQDAYAGGRTPAYGNDGNRTVNPYADGSRASYGGATSYGGSGSAWAAGTRTPYGAPDSSSGFSADPWSSGSKTPYGAGGSSWDSGSKTPAYGTHGGGDSWGASRPYDAPTPGLHSAPTPGNMNAPTPGAGYSAPTPRNPWESNAAPTPRGHYDSGPTPAAQTPGAWGGTGDDEPRYSTPSP